MFEKIVTEIKEPFYQQHFANDGQRFVAWYLRNVHLRDMNETRDDITDGADDKQIDAIVIDDERSTVVVIQGKFIGEKAVNAEPLREVLSSWVQLRNLVRLQEVANAKLKRKLSEVAAVLEDEYEIAFELLTTGELTSAAKDDLATFQKELAEIAENEDFVCSISVVDQDEIKRRHDIALEADNPQIHHTIGLAHVQHMQLEIAGSKVVIGALPLKDCVAFPGIKDGTLFQKNVRQSLGLNNSVNKGIRNTIYGDKYKDFFFFHNGVTAICNKIEMIGPQKATMRLHGLSIVNGCQSLNTILSCSEKVKTLDDTFILFRFYEIPQRERADRISINTNSQSAVKPRDLRSNDRRVVAFKRAFEQKYPTGFFISKRGESAPAEKDKRYVLDLADMAKSLISWHSQRPNSAHSETKLFDKYFEQLFRREYKPEDAQALNMWMQQVMKTWEPANPLNFNESLLAMKAYAPAHHLYAISMCFGISSNAPERVAPPSHCYAVAASNQLVDEIVKIAGISINMALEAAANEPQPINRVFSPQNWIKAKTCLAGINFAIRNYFQMLPMMPGGADIKTRLNAALVLDSATFEYRWAAD
ncbi:AIPR protein [Leptospira fainei serovar Hurstbridge str. BUT 6]|uniref:AIPR protein n=1 Tax=Leptospira fainei serovar Hurstbridge str. BUT 6 TaxID=1193011 RepID=S3UWM3_9LEPT|nr:AIPR family protein [Leptospira fainei]EPG72759.1 AIPR protein [Leptospira fainei serovar Hurstbridge str. BUT 6]